MQGGSIQDARVAHVDRVYLVRSMIKTCIKMWIGVYTIQDGQGIPCPYNRLLRFDFNATERLRVGRLPRGWYVLPHPVSQNYPRRVGITSLKVDSRHFEQISHPPQTV